MPDDRQQRYDEIMRRIQNRADADSPLTTNIPRKLEHILDDLNALDELERLARKRSLPMIMHGTKSIKGTADWVGVVNWYRSKGYYGYKTLTLLGIWLSKHDHVLTLTIGEKTLTYAKSVYNAESYHKLIRKGWRTYYDDNGAPPPDTLLHSMAYTPDERLQTRKVIQQVLNEWVTQIKQNTPTEENRED